MLKDNSSFHVPELYFEILSVALAAAPVIWNNILDVAKKDCLNETTDSLDANVDGSSTRDFVDGSPDGSPGTPRSDSSVTDSPKIDADNTEQ